MDRRRFLLSSLLGAAPAQLVIPSAVEPREPRHESSPFSESPTHSAELEVLANRLKVHSEIVEGYSRLLLREMTEADALRLVYCRRQKGLSERSHGRVPNRDPPPQVRG